MSSVVLKLRFSGDCYRVHVATSEDGAIASYEAVLEAIAKVWPAAKGEAVARYRDDEGDLCMLCQLTFPDFLVVSRRNGGKLELELAEKPPALVAPSTCGQNNGEPASSSREGCPWGHRAKHRKAHHAAWQKHWQNHLAAVHHQADLAGHHMDHAAAMHRHWHAHIAGHHMANKWNQTACKGGDEAWPMRPKKILWLASQLRANALLSEETAAALVVHFLPQAIARVAEHAPRLDRRIADKLPALQDFLQDFASLLLCSPGLESCASKIAGLTHGTSVASEAILELLTALSDLPFEEQIDFVKTVYANQESRLLAFLDSHGQQTHSFGASMVHHGITCDGCAMHPLKGPRFKCNACPDYDLCSKCYGEWAPAHGRECARQDFKCVLVDWSEHARKHMGMWGRGEGCHRKRSRSTDDEAPENPEARPCAGGCGFQATWHKTHCCGACAGSRPFHGPRCQQKRNEPAAAAAVAPKPEAPQGAAEEPTCFDLSFPVEVADGRNLVIQWNLGDRPLDTVEKFATRHGIQADELPTIVAFVEHATAEMLAAKVAEVELEPRQAAAEALEAAAEEDKAMDAERDTENEAKQPSFDFSCPVAVGDGSSLRIEWNRGDDAAEVAAGFAARHGIPEEEIPAIACFVTANAATRDLAVGNIVEEQPGSGTEPAAKRQHCCPGGCGYLVTWHATHCCAACTRGGGKHGPRCSRKPTQV